MTRFRIYTERRGNLSEIVTRRFDGFTLFEGLGFWKGTPERSTIIEIIGTPYDRWKVDGIVQEILWVNHQESILVTEEEIRGEFITREEAVA